MKFVRKSFPQNTKGSSVRFPEDLIDIEERMSKASYEDFRRNFDFSGVALIPL